MNTRIFYEYRDGSNYRFGAAVVVAGEMTDDLWARMSAACEGRRRFIAHQVGFPECFGFLPGPHIDDPKHRHDGYALDDENDHCWHEILKGPETWELTSDAPTDKRSVNELVKAFEAARKKGWEVFDPGERFGFW